MRTEWITTRICAYCSTVWDLYQTWRAVQEKKLLRPETLRMMATADSVTEHMNAQDPKMHYGLALTLNHEDDHRSIGQHGSLLGFSGAMYEFPADQLTIVVLTNTEGQNAYAISRSSGASDARVGGASPAGGSAGPGCTGGRRGLCR